jgi:hypothetical protein
MDGKAEASNETGVYAYIECMIPQKRGPPRGERCQNRIKTIRNIEVDGISAVSHLLYTHSQRLRWVDVLCVK